MPKEQIEKLVSLFFEVGTLRKIPRAHQQTLLFQDLSDNIASHSFRVAFIGYFLAENLGADSGKVVKMCLLHDIEEARTGDQNWLNKTYIKSFEDEVRKDQIKGLKNTEDFKMLSKEFDAGQTIEAKIAKDADLLDEMFLLKEYAWQGSKEAEDWLYFDENLKCEQEKRLQTDLAKQIAQELKRQKPSNWWRNSWNADKR